MPTAAQDETRETPIGDAVHRIPMKAVMAFLIAAGTLFAMVVGVGIWAGKIQTAADQRDDQIKRNRTAIERVEKRMQDQLASMESRLMRELAALKVAVDYNIHNRYTEKDAARDLALRDQQIKEITELVKRVDTVLRKVERDVAVLAGTRPLERN